MDGAVAVLLISLAMFVGCFLLGLIPLLVNFSQEKQQFITVLGAGLLCGTALAIIIPEGVELLEGSSRDSFCSVVTAKLNASDLNSTLKSSREKRLRPHVFIGASLVLGFTLMFVVDQIADYYSAHVARASVYSGSTTATLGLLIHAAACVCFFVPDRKFQATGDKQSSEI